MFFTIYRFNLVRYPVSWSYVWLKYDIPSNFSHKSHRKYLVRVSLCVSLTGKCLGKVYFYHKNMALLWLRILIISIRYPIFWFDLIDKVKMSIYQFFRLSMTPQVLSSWQEISLSGPKMEAPMDLVRSPWRQRKLQFPIQQVLGMDKWVGQLTHTIWHYTFSTSYPNGAFAL